MIWQVFISAINRLVNFLDDAYVWSGMSYSLHIGDMIIGMIMVILSVKLIKGVLR